MGFYLLANLCINRAGLVDPALKKLPVPLGRFSLKSHFGFTKAPLSCC
jgi:hypothetical protein